MKKAQDYANEQALQQIGDVNVVFNSFRNQR
jgi:hypothetical protein